MNPADTQSLFDAHYYATGCGLPYRRDEAWQRFFGGVADQIVAEIAPTSALDAGCALGLLVEQLRERGVAAEGVDISEYAIANAPEAVRPFVRVGSVTEPFGRRYDLIVCIEVLEHMPPEGAERAIANLCAHSDDVLFSSSPHDYKEATHFNVNPPEHWAARFARHGLYHDLEFDASFITPWAARFRRRAEPPHQIVRAYERRLWELRRENADLRQLALEQREQLSVAHGAAADLARHDERLAHLQAELQAAHAYAARIEAALAEKNTHIARVEDLLRRVEHGRVMRILQTLTGRRRG